jgi:hypothetical protein
MVKRKKTPSEATDAATAKIRALAREAGAEALSGLLGLARDAKSESVKLAAIKELLDRGFGRASSETPGGATMHLMVDDGYAN